MLGVWEANGVINGSVVSDERVVINGKSVTMTACIKAVLGRKKKGI